MVEVEEERKIKRKIMTGGRQTEHDGEYGMGIKKEKKKEKKMNGGLMLAVNMREVGVSRVKKRKKEEAKKIKRKDKRKRKMKRKSKKEKKKEEQKRKRKEKASRRSRGAMEMGRRGKKRKKKNKEKKKKGGLLARTPAALQAAPARETMFRVWSAGWGGGSRTEEVNGVGRETGRRLEGKIGNGKMEEEWKPGGKVLAAWKCAPRVFAFKKPKLQKSIWRLINELAAAAGVEMEPGDVGRLAPEAKILPAEKMCTSCFRA